MKVQYRGVGIILFFSFLLIGIYAVNSVSRVTLTAHLVGTWYEGNPTDLKKQLLSIDAAAQDRYVFSQAPFPVNAVIVPHAGYDYSGVVAAGVYKAVDSRMIKRIVVLAPIHVGEPYGFVVTKATKYLIPGAEVTLDYASAKKLATKNDVVVDDTVFNTEHSFEIQLPLIAHYFPDAIVLPILVGPVTSDAIDAFLPALQSVLDGQTLLVISSDITHYGPRFGGIRYYHNVAETIALKDSFFMLALERGDNEEIQDLEENGKLSACGINPIKVLMRLMRNLSFPNAVLRLVAYDNSSSHSGDRANVVTYAGCIVAEDTYLQSLNRWEKSALLQYAHRVLRNEFKDLLTEDDFFMDNFAFGQIYLALNSFSAQEIAPGELDMHLLPFLHTRLLNKMGAFVTLYSRINGEKTLRGCIGTLAAQQPLVWTIHDMVRAAAVNDTRFTPVTLSELDAISIEISLLTPPRPIDTYKDIILGKHGVVLHKKNNAGIDVASALFLPQVAREHDMRTVEEMLGHLSQKAGLDVNGWQAPDVSFEVFEAEYFSDDHVDAHS